jgi:hypothetical protein
MAKIFSAAKEVVNFDADAKLPEGPIRAAVAGKNEGKWFGQMRGDVVKDALFDAGLTYETNAALGEVTNAAVKQAAGAAAGAEGEIVLLDETDAQTAHGGVANDARTNDATANDEHVELGFGKSLERALAGGRRLERFAQFWI